MSVLTTEQVDEMNVSVWFKKNPTDKFRLILIPLEADVEAGRIKYAKLNDSVFEQMVSATVDPEQPPALTEPTDEALTEVEETGILALIDGDTRTIVQCTDKSLCSPSQEATKNS